MVKDLFYLLVLLTAVVVYAVDDDSSAGTSAMRSATRRTLEYSIGLGPYQKKPFPPGQDAVAILHKEQKQQRVHRHLKGKKKKRNKGDDDDDDSNSKSENSNDRSKSKKKKSGSDKLKKTDKLQEEEIPDPCNPQVGATRSWPSGDSFLMRNYMKPYQLRTVGVHVEVWVADDLSFPGDDDCRNMLPDMLTVTNEQAEALALEFDTHIYPTLTTTFSTPPFRNGTNSNPFLLEEFNVTADCPFEGDGNRIVVLVDNIRDGNFYDPLGEGGQISSGGFFAFIFGVLTDRNVMVVDSFDWVHRTGLSPPDDTQDPALVACSNALDINFGRPYPRQVESILGHEILHLMSSYTGPPVELWAEEGIASYAQAYVLGYADTVNLDPQADSYFPGDLKTFLGFRGRGGGPEQSLTTVADQGFSEIVADYGCAHSFMLYLTGRFGASLVADFHRAPFATSLPGFGLLLGAAGYQIATAQIIKDWRVALAVGGELTKGAIVLSNSGISRQALEFPLLSKTKIKWSNSETYSSPGAPNNGADFVRLRGIDGTYLSANTISTLSFRGSPTYPQNPTEWIREDSPARALYSGSDDDLDRFLVRQLPIPANGLISLDLSYEIETGWDFFYFQIYDDTTGEWISLASQDTTFFGQTGPIDPAPGLTGSSRGDIVTQDYDASAFAGKTAYVALRYVTDPGVREDGVRFHAMRLGGVDLMDATDLIMWKSNSEVFPVSVEEWCVTLIAYTPGGGVVYASDLSLGSDQSVMLDAGEIKSLVGTDASVVAALVTVIDSSEDNPSYARYELSVNSVLQPGGGS